MPHVTKSKLNLRVQAALARSSRNSSTSRNTTRPTTPSHSLGPSTHTTLAVSPSPLNAPDVVSDEENDEIQENHENVYQYLPDIHIFNENPKPESPEEEEGYHTDDDLSELEDDKLEESLKQQREGENESSNNMDQDTRNVFHTLMRDVSKKQWKKAESK